MRPPTLCIHAGSYLDERTGGACSPIFPSTASWRDHASTISADDNQHSHIRT
jgi:hypothetical protein